MYAEIIEQTAHAHIFAFRRKFTEQILCFDELRMFTKYVVYVQHA